MKNQRVRTIDVNKLSEEQISVIEEKLIEKINPIVVQAIMDANKFLNPYGLKAVMAFEITQKE